jgi:hypothetical protein
MSKFFVELLCFYLSVMSGFLSHLHNLQFTKFTKCLHDYNTSVLIIYFEDEISDYILQWTIVDISSIFYKF